MVSNLVNDKMVQFDGGAGSYTSTDIMSAYSTNPFNWASATLGSWKSPHNYYF